MKFYRNEQGDVRIVKELGSNHFVVVKLMHDRDAYTVKFWKGDLNKTAQYWTTKQFDPTGDERKKFIQAFKDVMNKMRPWMVRA